MLIPLLAFAIVAAQAAWIYLAHRRSRNREELFRIITENAADMIALVDSKGHRLYNSPAYEKILGYSPEELARTPIFEQIHPDDRFKVLEAGREARSTGVGQSLQYRLRHKNGEWRFLESTASTIKNERGEVEKLVIVNRDVTQRVAAEEKLAHNALHDALTDLPNRRLFLDLLERCFTRAQRDRNFHYALLLLDLDAFKSLNHTMGAAVGDQVLVETAHRLQSALRATDGLSRPRDESPADALLSRLGGDEFAILLEACADPSDVLRVAGRIHSTLSAPLLLNQGEVQTRVSIGCALVSTLPERAEAPLRDAETALRRAQAWEETAQNSSTPRCISALSLALNSSPTCAPPSNAASSECSTSPSFRSILARSSPSKRCCDGNIPNKALSRRTNFLRLPKTPASWPSLISG